MGEPDDGFLTVTFDGGRFVEHSVPVSVLAELATVQQLLAAVARSLFFHLHAERKRVPRGFSEASQLQLIASKANCYTAILDRSNVGAWKTSAPLFDAKLFESARDMTLAAFGAVADGTALPASFPPAALDLLGAVGRELGDNERLLLRGGKSSPEVRVDQSSRARIAQLAKQPLERDETIDGEVEQLDDATNRFWLRARNGDRVEVPFQSSQRLALVEALRDRPIARVRVKGRLVHSVQRKMKIVDEIEFVDHERAVDVQKLWERLSSLAEIRDGWLEGEGRVPTDHAIAIGREVLARLLIEHAEIERPKVFPTPEGGLQAEWVIGSWAAEARFNPEGDSVFLEATNGDTLEDLTLVVEAGTLTAEKAGPLASWLASLSRQEAHHV